MTVDVAPEVEVEVWEDGLGGEAAFFSSIGSGEDTAENRHYDKM